MLREPNQLLGDVANMAKLIGDEQDVACTPLGIDMCQHQSQPMQIPLRRRCRHQFRD